MDHVDTIIAQWKRERQELDTQPMALIGRLKRVSQYLTVGMGKTFKQFGLNSASFDVLATLRRSGEPFALSPSELMKTMMITSGTMTNRLDQLEKVQLVERIKNPKDGRGFLIQLTQKGMVLINKVMTSHVETQKSLVSALSEDERQQLNNLLHRFLESFEK
jgi:DNA-binding MarR family transcriptional regulator